MAVPEQVSASGQKHEPPSVNLVTRMCVVAVTFLVVMRTSIASIPLGAMVGLATAPMWLPALRRYRGGVVLAVTLIVALTAGIALTAVQAPINGGTSIQNLRSHSLLLVFIISSIGVLLWAREQLSQRVVGVTIGSGLLLVGIVSGSISSDFLWKTGFAIPVSIVILAATAGCQRWQMGLLALVALSLANIAFDSRSAFAICALSALLYSAQRRWSQQNGGSVKARAVSLLLAAAAAAAVLYQVASHLLMSGYLGEEARQRSIMQEELAGSMLIGGRPEMAATWALMQHRPAGFGAGAVPSNADLLVAKSGMWEINYQPDNGYVENYMFGGGIKLHSVIGDMWAYYGVAGFALALLITCLLVHALFVRLAAGTASALTIFLTCTALWNIPFGPLWGSTPILAVALGLALLPRDSRLSAIAANDSRSSTRPPSRTSARIKIR